MQIDRIDHFVLTVASIAATCDFFERALGMRREVFRPADGTTRTALVFGAQKINLHEAGSEFTPRARTALPGTGDFCLVVRGPLAPVIAHLEAAGVALEEGPVPKTGATGPIRSVYVRDPDGNLVEISTYDEA
jgi:catechol 2,3-dioxygenase-like lactoylglutathione lyase family enzyme